MANSNPNLARGTSVLRAFLFSKIGVKPRSRKINPIRHGDTERTERDPRNPGFGKIDHCRFFSGISPCAPCLRGETSDFWYSVFCILYPVFMDFRDFPIARNFFFGRNKSQ